MVGINQHVEAVDLEAAVALRELPHHRVVHVRLEADHRLRDHVVHVAPEFVGVDVCVFPEVLQLVPQRPFGRVGVRLALRLLEVLAHFVDAVVSEVYELVVAVFEAVLVRCEAHQSVVLDLDPQRVDAGHHHLDPQVVLELVDQVGVHYLVRHDDILFVFQVVFFGDDFDSAATGLVGWLDDPELFRVLLFELVDLEPVVVLREYLGHWTVVEGLVARIASFELQIVFPHHILAA